MKAMILAAGRGTRLHPHTLKKPKALVEVDGKPLLGYVLEKILRSGFDEVIVNIHHFAPMVVEYLQAHPEAKHITISDESDRLLDTGGAILKAKGFLNGSEPFLIHNVDILSDIDLAALMDFHQQNDPIATLAVGKRESSRNFLFDQSMRLAGWRNNITHKQVIPLKDADPLEGYAFAGIHVISPEFYTKIHKIGPFSIVEAYLSLCANYPILGLDSSKNFVLDVGKPHNLQRAHQYVANEG